MSKPIEIGYFTILCSPTIIVRTPQFTTGFASTHLFVSIKRVRKWRLYFGKHIREVICRIKEMKEKKHESEGTL